MKNAVSALAFAMLATSALAQQSSMTFFVTSANPGKGADLGGLEGADRYCQQLATAVGAGGKTWRAYLSTQGASAVNAKDRIGKGPWQNAKGMVIAKDVADLHGPTNILNKQTALTERGETVKGRGDQPNEHDILTGTQPDGTAFAAGEDKTCGNWTKGGEGSAIVGHHDRTGLDTSPPGAVVELVARDARMQHAAVAADGRRGLLLLLRRELNGPHARLACIRPQGPPRGRAGSPGRPFGTDTA